MNKGILGRICLILTSLIWGSSFVLMKLALNEVPTLWLIPMRFTIASIIFICLSNKKIFMLDRKAMVGSILMGISLAFAYLIQTKGLSLTTPGKNAFLTASYCILVPFIAWVMLKEKPTMKNLIAAIFCFIGMAFVLLNNEQGLLINIGDFITIGCGFFYALQIVQTKKYITNQDSLSVSTVMFISAAITCWIVNLISNPEIVYISKSSKLSILYLAVVCTGVCYFLQTVGVKYTPTSIASLLMTLESVFGVVFSVLFYKEKLNLITILGFSLIFISIVFNESNNIKLFNKSN